MQDNGFSALGVLGFRMVRSKEGEAVAKAVQTYFREDRMGQGQKADREGWGFAAMLPPSEQQAQSLLKLLVGGGAKHPRNPVR